MIGVPSDTWGETPLALIVRRPGSSVDGGGAPRLGKRPGRQDAAAERGGAAGRAAAVAARQSAQARAARALLGTAGEGPITEDPPLPRGLPGRRTLGEPADHADRRGDHRLRPRERSAADAHRSRARRAGAVRLTHRERMAGRIARDARVRAGRRIWRYADDRDGDRRAAMAEAGAPRRPAGRRTGGGRSAAIGVASRPRRDPHPSHRAQSGRRAGAVALFARPRPARPAAAEGAH